MSVVPGVRTPPFPVGIATREAYGRTLLELGRTNPDIVALCADLHISTFTHLFAREFPERFFDVGIAEQNLICIAAGLALSGKIPFVSTFAVFATAQCYQQLRVNVAQPRVPVKLVASHGGLTVGEDGLSHHGIEDLALMNALPTFTIIVPADPVEMAQAVRAAATVDGPVYVRGGRPPAQEVFTEEYQFQLGKAALLREGDDLTIVACGIMVASALEAAELLAQEGISCRVLNHATLRPADIEALVAAAEETGAIVTAEEHLITGGLGSIVASILAQHRPVPIEFVAIRDTYTESGRPDELRRKYGITTEDIVRAAQKVLKRKREHR